MAQDKGPVTLTQDVADLIAANPNLTVSRAQLDDILLGRTTRHSGCIRELRFDSDKELVNLSLDTATGVKNFNSNQVPNLGDFAQTLLAALNHGHGISFCIRPNGKMVMLNLRPCRCRCDKD